jgi:hypothetical protein
MSVTFGATKLTVAGSICADTPGNSMRCLPAGAVIGRTCSMSAMFLL